VPFTQFEPLGQLAHWLPSTPQALAAVPARQTPFWQHPAQFAGEHEGGAVQNPLEQIEPPGQLTHWLPNAPHANVELPVWQAPF